MNHNPTLHTHVHSSSAVHSGAEPQSPLSTPGLSPANSTACVHTRTFPARPSCCRLPRTADSSKEPFLFAMAMRRQQDGTAIVREKLAGYTGIASPPADSAGWAQISSSEQPGSVKDNASLWKLSPKPHFASPSFHRHKHTRGSVDSTFHSPGGRVRKNYAVNFKFLWEVPLFITANSAARSGALRTSAANSQL